MKEKLYNALAWAARYLLPAGAALWTALAKLWGLPYTAEIAGTLAALAAFLNALLGLSSVGYWREHEITEKEQPDDPAED